MKTSFVETNTKLIILKMFQRAGINRNRKSYHFSIFSSSTLPRHYFLFQNHLHNFCTGIVRCSQTIFCDKDILFCAHFGLDIDWLCSDSFFALPLQTCCSCNYGTYKICCMALICQHGIPSLQHF